MKCKQGDMATDGSDHQKTSLIKRAVLDMLLSQGTRPDATIDSIRAEHDCRRKGISKREFSLALMQLLENGLIEMNVNSFQLTKAAFMEFQQNKPSGNACAANINIGGADGS